MDYTREQIPENDERATQAARLVRQAADAVAPHGKEHVGTVCLHFFAGTDFISAKMEIVMVTQPVNLKMSPEAATLMIPEIRDKIFEMFGAQKQKLSPKTQEETLDTGGSLIKTSLDS